jgi:DNA-binding CsgD family transcriptional regulator
VSIVSTPPLVGRDLDLAVAREQLTRSARGTPASLLVRGEAGMGKSRLVAELADAAGGLGHPVVLGRADDLDHGIPFAAFRDLLARLEPKGPGADEADGLRAAIEGHRAEVDAEHLTEVFAAATRLLRALADGGPLVLVLEDVHVADGESLALAALLIRLAGLPVLTVVTLRPGGGAAELEQLCERMAFEGRGSVVDLELLDRADTRALAAAVIGAELDDAMTDAVVAASRGNPFFAGEVAQALVDGGAVAVADGRARLVPGAPAAQLPRSTVLLRRLVLGTAADLELAKVMAVFGRFSLHHLGLAGRLTGLSADGVAESFDRLVASGLLAHAAGAGYEFTHSILRDRLYDDIGPAERRRIHAAIAADLAVERGGGRVLDVLELATHVAASAEPGDAAAAEVLLEAGRTVGASAPLVSADYHRRALELLPVDAPRRAEAQAGRARALHLGARPREAAAVGLEALASLPAGPARGAIAALVVNDLYLDGRAGDALGVIDAELALGGDSCPLLAMRTNLALQSGRYAEAAETFGDAVAALDGADVTPAAELMALAHVVQYANHVGEVRLAAELMQRVEALAEGASSTVGLAAHELVAFADWRPGLVARIEEHLRVASALRPEGAALSIGGSSESARARVLWMRGRWDEALDLIGSAGFALDQRGTVTTAQLLACTACEIFVDRGDLDAAAATAARFETPILALARNAALARARIHYAVGEPDAALALLDDERADASVPRGSVWKLAEIVVLALEIHLAANRAEEARAALAELETLATRTGWLECQVPALRARALVDGDVDAARTYRDVAETESWEVERAHALLVLGELDDEPVRNLAEAYRAFDTFGAAPWRRRAAAGLRARGLTVPRRAARAASELTETEVQLVRLVRDGLSNRQIAAAMNYSRKTIEVYLSRVYAKTGCASRLELIRAVDTGAVQVGGADADLHGSVATGGS